MLIVNDNHIFKIGNVLSLGGFHGSPLKLLVDTITLFVCKICILMGFNDSFEWRRKCKATGRVGRGG